MIEKIIRILQCNGPINRIREFRPKKNLMILVTSIQSHYWTIKTP